MAGSRIVNLELSLDPSGMRGENQNTVAKAGRLADIVRDKNDRLSSCAPNLLQFFMQNVACLGVQRREGFVHQEDFGINGQCACQRDALLHSSGEFMDIRM